MSPLWWERYPERLTSELEELDRAGIRYERDEDAFVGGILRLRLYPVVDDEELLLVTTFPDLYPFFRFEVEAPNATLPHHQHPFSKVLCLIGRSTGNWHPGRDRLAHFIQERLRPVFRAAASADPDTVRDVEEHQAEPFSDYLSYLVDSLVLIDSAWSIDPTAQSGTLHVGVSSPARGALPTPVVNGAVLDVRDEKSVVLAEADPALAKRFPYPIRGRWVRFAAPPQTPIAEQIFKLAASKFSSLMGVPVQGGTIRVLGILFPEEIGWRTMGDGWLFAVRFEAEQAPLAKGPKHGRKARHPISGGVPYRYYLARPARAGRKDLMARIPELGPLADHRVAVFGLGCLGSVSALELARGGIGELRVVDHDHVDPAASVRWSLGFGAGGHQKARVLEQMIRSEYPYCRVLAYVCQIGSIREKAEQPSDADVVDRALQDASLLYDASAEPGVEYYLAAVARQRGIPYIGVSGTPGGWGGLIVRIVPGKTEGCWSCLLRRLEDGSILAPPADKKEGQIQPTGCANPTFTGASFDLGLVALSGVRMAVSTLTANQAGAYPNVNWDVAVISLRGPGGEIIAPQFATYPLLKHPQCQVCAARR